ncbi:helix-turn-helix domain-containing protein [Rhodococcus sp. KRD175]|uniref:helix-turn-helix domain-containing protein n=1 Tax=Rhodococcus sp. KRD175 TaxID=2729729 RepID=UPI0019D01942
MQELTLLRLGKARTMLSDPAMSHATNSEIAHRCGFSTVRTFQRAFVRAFSCTPAVYRDEQQRRGQ